MSQRMIAVCLAVPLLIALTVVAAAVPLPYAAYSPGPTFDVLGKNADSAELVQVSGHKAYRDDGQIRFTTVQSTPRERRLTLFEAIARWAEDDQAVVPYDVAHPDDRTAEDEKIEGQISMVTSQDTAVAVALREMGEKVTTAVQVAHVDEDAPASDVLQVRDIFVEVDGKRVRSGDDVVAGVQAHEPGEPVEFVIERDHERRTVEVDTVERDGEARIGVSLGLGYEFPYDVTISVDPNIGGPSAGLMFSLAVFDTLTPGSLTGGGIVAGTGELFDDGTVGPIGGIEQKIAGAEDAGAQLFFVPPDNCGDVAGLDPDLELVRAATMHDAREALEALVDDHDAELPRC
jgi:PDZ domain-containing protein